MVKRCREAVPPILHTPMNSQKEVTRESMLVLEPMVTEAKLPP